LAAANSAAEVPMSGLAWVLAWAGQCDAVSAGDEVELVALDVEER
jgi:hypothetical protein